MSQSVNRLKGQEVFFAEFTHALTEDQETE